MKRRYWAVIVVAALIVSFFALRPLVWRQAAAPPGGTLASGGDPPPPPPVKKTLPAGFLGGVVEGYYGPPWSTADTIGMIEFMSNHGLNTFVYAPKDDQFQRTKWRDLYPTASLQQLAVLVSACKRNNVTFVYSLSPGLSIQYSSAADGQALADKFDQLRSIGIDAFMLSFDDISGKLNTADTQAFAGDLGRAQSRVANALMTHEIMADPSFRLVLAPTTYSGVKDNPYWQSLKANLDQRAMVIWTGPHVLSATITSDQVKAVSTYIGHPLVIWDNYPTNDYTYAQTKRPQLFLGPLKGRDAGVPAAVAGYWFNPMLQARASELPLATGAQYLLDPAGYNADDAWGKAISELGGPVAASLRLFAEQAASYYYNNVPPAQLAADIAAVWKQPNSADLAQTKAYADFGAFERLTTDLVALPDAALYTELKPWLDTLSQQGLVGQLALRVLQEKHQKLTAPADVKSLQTALADLKANQNSIAGDAVTAFADRVLSQ